MTEPRQGDPLHATRPRHPERPCLNCGDPTYGEYCPTCGQHKIDVQVSLGTMVKDVLEDEFILGRRLPVTLAALLFRPGFLTSEVLSGRVVRYVRPFKLYLTTSVIFFLILSFVSLRALEVDEEAAEATQAVDADRVNMGLAAIDSAIAEIDAQLEGADVNTGTSIALATARGTLVSQRARLVESGDTTGTPRPSSEGGQAGEEEESNWLNLTNVDTGIERVDSVLVARAQRLGEMEPREAAREVSRTFLSYVPTLMFLLLPVFAGVLKLLYIRQRRYYAEHIIFVLHAHAFIFLIFSLMFLTRDWIDGWPLALLLLWVFVYIFLAMRRVYGQSRLKTFLKYWTLGWMYFWILVVGIPVLFIVSILLLPA